MKTTVTPRDRYQFGTARARRTDAERTAPPLSAQGSTTRLWEICVGHLVEMTNSFQTPKEWKVWAGWDGGGVGRRSNEDPVGRWWPWPWWWLRLAAGEGGGGGERERVELASLPAKVAAGGDRVLVGLPGAAARRDKGISILTNAIKACTEEIDRHKGKLIVKEAPRAVSERDDKLLAEHMAKLQSANEEVDGDEGSEEEEEEDTGMGEVDVENSGVGMAD
uniref:Uncharacterized protein n=1 Tax=Ananas comosus var. bracteatus TaxID=296719 RepID=A0A6V7PT18_ANACO|nr:unnamed protein product [Ananas comosus var. bracteatus]